MMEVVMVGWSPDRFPTGVDETMELGRQLSLILGCPVRLVSWAKPQYECWHNIMFPQFMVKGCIESGNNQKLVDKHKEESKWEK